MHTIRLRGFWETAKDGGHTVHSRSFGRPRTLDPGERVWLVCDSLPAPATVTVNGKLVGSLDGPGPFAADITDEMAMRNVVKFAVAAGELIGNLVLEIRSTSD